MSTLKLPYGLKDGAPQHICDVPKGLACGCICPVCNNRLVAKKGGKRVHHFAHHSEANPECKWATESLIHLKAKEILEKERRVWIPAVIVKINGYDRVVSDAGWFAFDDVHVEKNLGAIRPDLIVQAGSYKLLIEIAVHHFCDEPKVAKIRKSSIPAIEIDLSKIDLYENSDAIYDNVLQTAPRNWLFNPEATSFAEKEAARLANPRSRSAEVIDLAKAELKNADKWLDARHADLGNRTPREAAMTESDHDIGMINFLIGQASRRGY